MKQETITHLRQNLYQTVDDIIRTGEPVVITRHQFQVQLSLVSPPSKLSRLRAHKTIVGNPDDLISPTVSQWNEAKNL